MTELNGGFTRAALDTEFDRTLIVKSALVALLVVGALIHDYVLVRASSASCATPTRPHRKRAAGS